MFDTKRFSLLALLGCLISSSVAATLNANKGQVKHSLYEYDILREGVPVGSHVIEVEYHDALTRVVSRSLIEIGFLGFTFYRFQYESIEKWDDQGLQQLSVRVDDDGQRLEIDGRRNGDRFSWSTNNADSKSHEMPVFPTNHWNPSVLKQEKVLNTLTGSMNRVYIRPHEEEFLVFGRVTGEIEQFRYDGELRLDAWYDSSGRWMGMRFKGKDGSTIEYICRSCRV